MSPPWCPAGASRRAPSSASTCPSPPPCSARATTRRRERGLDAARTAAGRRRSSGWCPGVPGTDRWHATVVARPRGPLDLRASRRGATRSPPGGTRSRSRSRPARVPRTSPTTSRTAPGCCERALRNVPTERRARARRRRPRRCATAAATSPHRVGPALAAEPAAAARTSTRCASWSPARPRYEVWVDRQRALFSAWYEFFPRSEGAGDPAGRHPGPARHVQGRGRAGCPQIAEHGLRRRLPAADPPDRQGQPQGPEQHASTPGPEDVGSPVGDRLATRAATTRSTRSSARWRTSTPSWRATRELGMEVALDFALQAAPDHPWVTEHPEWFTTSPTARSRTPRTRRRSTRTSTRSTSTTTPRASTPSACGSCGSGSTHGRADLPRRQPAHQAAELLALADLARSRRPTPTCSSWPRRSPGRR